MSKAPLPLVSVVMPVYNCGRFLRESIESVLAQTYQNFELIIINDGSTDESESLINSFQDQRIRYFKNERNQGIVYTLNKGFDLAQGEFIARMDGDDICLPQRFEMQVQHLSLNPEIAVLATLIKIIDEDNAELGFWNDDFNNVNSDKIAHFITRLNCIAHPSIMMRSSIVKDFRYEQYKNAEDWALWLDILSKGHKIAKLNTPLLLYRIHNQSLTNSNAQNAINRIISFKLTFLLKRILSFQFGKIEFAVLLEFFKDFLKYKMPILFSLIAKCKETRSLDFLRQYIAFKREFESRDTRNNKVYFFFPFFHIGGAEVVHLEIVKAAVKKRPIVFFTSNSVHSYILDQMRENAIVLKIDQLLIWPFVKNRVIKKLRKRLLNDSEIKLFSSNSKFFYSFLQRVPDNIVAIDLVHAFMHKHELESSESWSLPVVSKLSHRIVINKKTLEDFSVFYAKNKVDSGYLNRIIFNANFVEELPKREIKNSESFNVLYVGRNSPEKRVGLISLIAKEVASHDSTIEFHFVGDVNSAIPNDCKEFCKLHGEIADRDMLNSIYSNCHMLILASEREGFPLVIMEGMYNGLVTITTDVGGISEHINSSNGILIKEASNSEMVTAFARSILELAHDTEKWLKLSENAYNYAKVNFSKDRFYRFYNELFS